MDAATFHLFLYLLDELLLLGPLLVFKAEGLVLLEEEFLIRVAVLKLVCIVMLC